MSKLNCTHDYVLLPLHTQHTKTRFVTAIQCSAELAIAQTLNKTLELICHKYITCTDEVINLSVWQVGMKRVQYFKVHHSFEVFATLQV